MKVSLIFPRMKYKSGDPPLGMALLTAIVRDHGHEVDLIDTTFHPTHEYVQEQVKKFNPDFVAVSPGQVLVIGRDESVTKIDPLHVVAIEEPRKKAPKPRGKRAR